MYNDPGPPPSGGALMESAQREGSGAAPDPRLLGAMQPPWGGYPSAYRTSATPPRLQAPMLSVGPGRTMCLPPGFPPHPQLLLHHYANQFLSPAMMQYQRQAGSIPHILVGQGLPPVAGMLQQGWYPMPGMPGYGVGAVPMSAPPPPPFYSYNPYTAMPSIALPRPSLAEPMQSSSPVLTPPPPPGSPVPQLPQLPAAERSLSTQPPPLSQLQRQALAAAAAAAPRPAASARVSPQKQQQARQRSTKREPVYDEAAGGRPSTPAPVAATASKKRIVPPAMKEEVSPLSVRGPGAYHGSVPAAPLLSLPPLACVGGSVGGGSAGGASSGVGSGAASGGIGSATSSGGDGGGVGGVGVGGVGGALLQGLCPGAPPVVPAHVWAAMHDERHQHATPANAFRPDPRPPLPLCGSSGTPPLAVCLPPLAPPPFLTAGAASAAAATAAAAAAMLFEAGQLSTANVAARAREALPLSGRAQPVSPSSGSARSFSGYSSGKAAAGRSSRSNSSGGGDGGLDAEDRAERKRRLTSEERLQRSRERNRIHARKTRQRKKAQIQSLQGRAEELRDEQRRLRQALKERKTASILLVMSSGLGATAAAAGGVVGGGAANPGAAAVEVAEAAAADCAGSGGASSGSGSRGGGSSNGGGSDAGDSIAGGSSGQWGGGGQWGEGSTNSSEGDASAFSAATDSATTGGATSAAGCATYPASDDDDDDDMLSDDSDDDGDVGGRGGGGAYARRHGRHGGGGGSESRLDALSSSAAANAAHAPYDVNYELLQKDRSECTPEELEMIRRERNRMHAKRTRERKKLYTEETASTVQRLEYENQRLLSQIARYDPPFAAVSAAATAAAATSSAVCMQGSALGVAASASAGATTAATGALRRVRRGGSTAAAAASRSFVHGEIDAAHTEGGPVLGCKRSRGVSEGRQGESGSESGAAGAASSRRRRRDDDNYAGSDAEGQCETSSESDESHTSAEPRSGSSGGIGSSESSRNAGSEDGDAGSSDDAGLLVALGGGGGGGGSSMAEGGGSSMAEGGGSRNVASRNARNGSSAGNGSDEGSSNDGEEQQQSLPLQPSCGAGKRRVNETVGDSANAHMDANTDAYRSSGKRARLGKKLTSVSVALSAGSTAGGRCEAGEDNA